jgi:glycosyltransferase involved in cell wall biosynthesis
MSRPIIFDATHLIARQGTRTPTGIDRVDHAYAAEFSRNGGMACGVQCMFSRPRLLSPETVGHYVGRIEQDWREDSDVEADPQFQSWRGFVKAPAVTLAPQPVVKGGGKPSLLQRWSVGIRVGKGLLAHDSGQRIPQNGIFLNVTQNPTLTPRAGRFLASRPDLKAVFLVHDLIPIDYPEYFPPGRKGQFEAVLATMYRHATALITTTEAVRQRLLDDMRQKGVADRPIHVAHLPVSPGFERPGERVPDLNATRYVVLVGTVEPRKNHRMMLHVWRQMERFGDDPPRLVIVGARGWNDEPVQQMLLRSPELARSVLHVSGLSNEALRYVIGHARALLMPSFIEGFGIPLVESAALGTPIIASDLPVFAEVSQGLARLVDPLDGPGWRRAVLDIAGPLTSPRSLKAETLPGFDMQTNAGYFRSIRAFLAEL